jgi:hypothetical protein
MKLSLRTWVLFGIVFSICAVMRIAWFPGNQILGQHDVIRDYLVADAIVRYGDIPLIGPVNSVLAGIRNSPVYYYLLAVLLIPYNDVLALQAWGIVFQLLNLILAFLLFASLARARVAMIAVFLYGIASGVVLRSGYIWQPHVMEPFLIASFLFLARFHAGGRARYAWVGAGFIGFAALLHPSVFILLPVYVSVAGWLLHRRGYAPWTLLAPAGISVAVLLAGFAPVALAYYRDPAAFPPALGEGNVNLTFFRFPERLAAAIAGFALNVFFDYSGILGVMTIAIASLYLLLVREPGKRVICLLYAAVLLPFVAIAALSRVSYAHHYTPVTALYVFLLVYSLDALTRRLRYGTVIFAGGCLLMGMIFLGSPTYLAAQQNGYRPGELRQAAEGVASLRDNEGRLPFRLVHLGIGPVDGSMDYAMMVSVVERRIGYRLQGFHNGYEDVTVEGSGSGVIILCTGATDFEACRTRAVAAFPEVKRYTTVFDGERYHVVRGDIESSGGL